MRGLSKKWWLIAAIIVFIGLSVGGVFLWRNLFHAISSSSGTTSTTSPTQQLAAASSVCSAALISQANAPLAASDQNALGQVVDKITVLKNFDLDPNCLYIVLVFNIAAGNSTMSQNYMNKFSLVYDPAIGLSSAFTVPLISLDTLKSDVAFLMQNQSAASQKQDATNLSDGSNTADKYVQEHKQ